jgi:hypothetical protein
MLKMSKSKEVKTVGPIGQFKPKVKAVLARKADDKIQIVEVGKETVKEKKRNKKEYTLKVEKVKVLETLEVSEFEAKYEAADQQAAEILRKV